MSIVTMKRKTEHNKFKQLSHDKTFSLNGGYRNSGYVGQTNLSRSVKRTPYSRNGLPKTGSGFTTKPVVNSGTCSNNDIQAIKPSVLSSKGMIANKYKWMKRGYPYAVVQPDDNANLKGNDSQRHYIENKRLDCGKIDDNNNWSEQVCNTNNSGCKKFIGSKKRLPLAFAKPFSVYSNYEEYMQRKRLGPCSKMEIFPKKTDGRTNTRCVFTAENQSSNTGGGGGDIEENEDNVPVGIDIGGAFVSQ